MTDTTKIYFELHVRTVGTEDFHIDFGDYDREVVAQELEDRIGDTLYGENDDQDRESKRSDYKIVRVEEITPEIVEDSVVIKTDVESDDSKSVSLLSGGRTNTGTILKFRFETMQMFLAAGRIDSAQKCIDGMWKIFNELDRRNFQIGIPVDEVQKRDRCECPESEGHEGECGTYGLEANEECQCH